MFFFFASAHLMIELPESRLDFDRVREAKIFGSVSREIRDVSEICALRYGLKEGLLMSCHDNVIIVEV